MSSVSRTAQLPELAGQPPNLATGTIMSEKCPVCKKAYTETQMVQCTNCPIWTHYLCAGVGDEVANDRSWKCINCNNLQQNELNQSTVETSQTSKTIVSKTSKNGRAIIADDPTKAVNDGKSSVSSNRSSVMEQLKLLQEEQEILKRQQVLVQKRQELMEKLSNCSVTEKHHNQPQIKAVNTKQNILCKKDVSPELVNEMTHKHFPCGSQENDITPRQLAARQTLPKYLPIFSGNPSDWPVFINMYKQSTAACGFSDCENLIRLQNSIQGTARAMVEDQLRTPSSVEAILDTLEMLFGRPELVLDQQIQRLRKMPAPKMEKLESFVSFAMGVKNICANLSQAGMEHYICNPMLMKELQDKLPPTMLVSWAQYKRYSSDPNSLETLSAWLYEVATDVCSVSTSTIWTSREDPSTNKSTPSNQLTQKKGKTQQNLHQHSEIESPDINVLDNSQSVIPIPDTRETHLSHHSQIDVKFRMIPVVLSFNGKIAKTNAFLDEGSTSSLIEERIAKELGLIGELDPLHLRWTGSVTRTENESKRVEINISGAYRNAKQFTLKNVRTVNSLNLPSQSIDYPRLAKQHPHLRHLPVMSYANVTPGILIGLRNWSVAVPLKVKEGDENEPIAVYCRLGWTIFCSTNINKNQNANEIEVIDFQYLHHDQEDNLNEIVKEFLSVDSLGITAPDHSKWREEEKRAMNLLNSTTSYNGTRYETGLLWRGENIKLPDSRPMALQRLYGLEKRLKSNHVLAEKVKEQIEKYLEKGYIRKLTADDIQIPQERKWYLPMFPVENVNKPGKVRLVWDAAADVQGISLNTMLMKGIDLNSSLYGILLRCRQRKVCIAADIKEMFHQILMSEHDQHVLRFLWRDLDETKVPDTYVLQVMAFGPTCSPSSAQYIKNRNAEGFGEEFPRAVNCIINNHYVDDLLDSVDTEEEALLLASQVTRIHQHAGFEIRNWRSNSKRFMEVLNPSTHDVNINMRLDQEHSTEKILGMWWNLSTDEFTFSLQFNKGNREVLNGEKRPTKREALRILMSIYDPLGLIAHFLVFLKILLQEIWRSHIDWDDQITDAQFDTWLYWLKLLPKVEHVRISRWYLKDEANWNGSNVQLHIFTDASEQACAAVAFLRIKTEDQVICSLVSAKTKVAPIKLRSIPRLELDAAVMGCRLAQNIHKQLTITIHDVFYWSDSRTILAWIRSEPRNHDKFIAFRVAEIQDDSNVRNWRYVQTKVNVADDATKWRTTSSFDPSDRWFRGPEFLYQEEAHWPKNIFEDSSELFGVHMVQSPLVIFDRFSRWKRLLRSMAYVVRFLNNSKKDSVKQNGILKQEELFTAEMELFKMVQRDVFHKEIVSLNKKTAKGMQVIVDKSSPIYKLSPYLDEDGILRVQGRLDAAVYLQFDTRRPIILPRGHRVTKLIILNEHEAFLHQNYESVINKLHQRFRIPHLRSEVKSVLLECQLCKIRKAKPVPPQMAPLPVARLSAYVAPFTFVGVDYFGPLTIKCGRRCEKRWGVLFTCMTTRAVHVEIANKCDSDTFILCFNDFISRRGYPSEIFCDRGTNFIGAERMLRQELQAVDPEMIAKRFVSPRLKWNFNPPASPHMGGSWERLVKCFKLALYASLPESNPSDQLLRSCLISAENLINSRPLTHIQLHDEDEEVLTPNHFLGLATGNIKPISDQESTSKNLKLNYQCKERFTNKYWKIFVDKYLPELTLRSKWFQPALPLEVGDLVLIIDKELPRNNYPKGIITEVRRAPDGQVRSATVRTSHGYLERPAVKLARLEIKKE